MPLNVLLSFVLSIVLVFCGASSAIAQASSSVDQIINTTFNQMPPFETDGYIPSFDGDLPEKLGYSPAREWLAGQLPSEVVEVGDIDTGLGASLLTIQQISELTGLDIRELSIENLEFLRGVNLNEFLKDVPFLGDWQATDIPELAELAEFGSIFSGEGTLNEVLGTLPDLGELGVLDVLGELPISAIPNLDVAQLADFAGIGDQVIANIPGLGDIPLGSFPIPVSLPSINAFPMQDIAFGPKEYSGEKATPQPVSGGTNGGKVWKSLACSGGCPHIELAENGWKGATWMTKAHRVKDGYGLLGSFFGEAGAYRLPFGPSFALQVTNTDEKTGQAEWGIAFRVCKNGFIDLGCTAYFLEVPLGIETKDGDNILTGVRDGLGGATVPMEAPPGWEELRPAIPPELQSKIRANLPSSKGKRGRKACGSSAVSGDIVERAVSAIEELGWTGAKDDVSLIVGAAIENGITDPAHISYILATAAHESDGFRTMVEYGKGAGKAYGEEYGRGYIQVTWRENRQKLDDILGINSADNPDLLTDPQIAAQAAAIGMRDGIYTGVSLNDYGSGDNFDWEGARTIINDGDRRPLIGNYGRSIFSRVAGVDTTDVKSIENEGCSSSGGVASLGDASLEEILYEYEPASFQDFDAYREYRDSYHGGLDLDYRAGFGEGGAVTSLTEGELLEIRTISYNQITGEPSVSVRILTYDENGNEIEQRYTHLSESSVRAALGVGIGDGQGMKIEAGQAIGVVGGDDEVSGGAHLDYKVLVNSNFSNPLDFMETLATGDTGGTLGTLDIHSGARGQITIGNVGGKDNDNNQENSETKN